jgi:hypothetical protein
MPTANEFDPYPYSLPNDDIGRRVKELKAHYARRRIIAWSNHPILLWIGWAIFIYWLISK